MSEAKQKTLPSISVKAGETWRINETTRLSELNIAEGAVIAAPEGKSVTMTVNGVEMGGKLVTTGGTETKIAAGTYLGNIVLTVTKATPVPYAMGGGPPGGGEPKPLIFPFRQALYLDETGVVEDRSVLEAVAGKKTAAFTIKDIQINSVGENFNGIYAVGGNYIIKDTKINLNGNGRSDFIGAGAAITSTGEKTKVVVDGAFINNRGVVRAAIVADGGSNMIVKNSNIQTYSGMLPADYIPTIDTTQMRSVPWMLGLSGNVRATNLLGTNTKATYINSSIASEGWGVLSTDGCTDPKLTVINCFIAITGPDGYGSYVIGNATERFLGCEFNVSTYATVNRGGSAYFGDSTPAAVAQLNKDLDLGLTGKEIKSLLEKHTVVNSGRNAVMWHGDGSVDVSGGTVFNTKEATFLNKGQAVKISVDGSRGARLNPGNGIILQVIENDDVGPSPDMSNTNTFREPAADPVKVGSFDLTAVHPSDTIATFSKITLKGDFYNGFRGGPAGGPPPGAGGPGGGPGGTEGPGGPGGGGGGPMSPPAGPGGNNMALNFNDAGITGVISASEARHAVPAISAENFRELGAVTNKVRSAINNGVIVSLNGSSKWTVTGKSYLTRLDIAPGVAVTAPTGRSLSMTIDGVKTPIKTGTYKGTIVLTVD